MRRFGFLVAAALVSGLVSGGAALGAPARPAPQADWSGISDAEVIQAGGRHERRGEWRERDGRRREEWRDGDGRRGEWRERAERRESRWDGDRHRHERWDGDRHRDYRRDYGRDWRRGHDRGNHYGWGRGRHYGWDRGYRDHGHRDWKHERRHWRAHHHPRHRHWIGRPMPRVEYVVIRDYDSYYLPPPRRGHFYARVDNDVYLVAEATKSIIDAFVLLDAATRY